MADDPTRPETSVHCDGCGRPVGDCDGCRSPHDPARFCPRCGRRLAVLVTPTGHRSRCRDHGEVASGGTGGAA